METTRQLGEGRLYTFLASGWNAEVVFHAGIAEALRKEGNRVHVVAVGARYRDAYEQTGAFDAVFDLTTWPLNQPACQGAPPDGWIEAIEEKLAIPSLWQLLSADRYLCRHSFDKNVDAVRFQDHFWETYFQEHSPALLFGEVSHFHNWLASLWAKKEGVPYIQPITSRIPKRTSFGDGSWK